MGFKIQLLKFTYLSQPAAGLQNTIAIRAYDKSYLDVKSRGTNNTLEFGLKTRLNG